MYGKNYDTFLNILKLILSMRFNKQIRQGILGNLAGYLGDFKSIIEGKVMDVEQRRTVRELNMIKEKLDELLGKEVPLKGILREGKFYVKYYAYEKGKEDKRILEEFENEVKAIERLRGESISMEYVGKLERGGNKKIVNAIIFEYEEGFRTAFNYVKENEGEEEEVVKAVREVVEKMGKRGVLHNNLTADNVLIKKGENGYEVRIVNFQNSKICHNRIEKEQIKKELRDFTDTLKETEVCY